MKKVCAFYPLTKMLKNAIINMISVKVKLVFFMPRYFALGLSF